MCIYAKTYGGILLAMKKNEIMPLAVTWMDLKIILLILGEVRQRMMNIYHYMWNVKKGYKYTYLQN